MQASSVTRRVLASFDARKWAWWQTPWPLRLYVGLIPLVAFGLTIYAATQTTWHASDLAKFVLLLGCGMVSVAATPRTAYVANGMTRDFLTVWVLPVAVLLPPVYAMLAPIPLQILTLRWRHVSPPGGRHAVGRRPGHTATSSSVPLRGSR